MVQTVHLTSSAQLYENDTGDLAIRFENNEVYEGVGAGSGKSFVSEALEMLESGDHPPEWQKIPFRKLLSDGHNWHLVSSLGYLDGDKSRPAVGLDVKPEVLGKQAKRYLQPDMPQVLA
jgi:hypothetical protein